MRDSWPPKDGDTYPDSGWRLRGDWRAIDEDAFAARKAAYVALGAVLNVDDSWLHLIDAPVGARFERDVASEPFHRVVK